VLRYEDIAERAMAFPLPDYPCWPGVTPGFDNTAKRRRNATILVDPSPETYERWLVNALERSTVMANKFNDGPDGLVFINAWNEWGEGNHLEPDQRHGSEYLDATRKALEIVRSSVDS
jgi:lipopolysaccharide biosynthesis protein